MGKIYLSQRELFDEIVECRIKGRISNKLGEMFLTLSRKNTNHRYFVRYYHIQSDLVAIGAASCCKGFYKFRPFKDKTIVWDEQSPIEYNHVTCNNAFAFFTTIIHHDFIAFLKKEYDQSNITNELRLTAGLDASEGYNDMIATKDKKVREERKANGITNQSLFFSDETVWDNFEEEESDDDVIDWNETSSS